MQSAKPVWATGSKAQWPSSSFPYTQQRPLLCKSVFSCPPILHLCEELGSIFSGTVCCDVPLKALSLLGWRSFLPRWPSAPAPSHLRGLLLILLQVINVLYWRSENWMPYSCVVIPRYSAFVYFPPPTAHTLLIQPRLLLIFDAMGSCSAHCLSKPHALFPADLLSSQAVQYPGVPFPMQGFAFVLVKSHQTPAVPFLQPVWVPLGGSLAFQHVASSPQLHPLPEPEEDVL